ncbi:MAG: 2-iminobutanoate/2-iminopropanoate deaminase [Bacteroidia bacterium]|jgi:2-iminobutanoate/2-iminopropanoate deaminase
MGCDKNTNANQQEMETLKKIISTSDAPAAIGPYSQAVLVGNTLYCSGQIALDPATSGLVVDNISSETQQVMTNIGAVLKASDMDYSNIVKATIFMTSMEDYAQINAVYAEYFPVNPPAREAVAVSTLPKNVSVEISVIAIKE